MTIDFLKFDRTQPDEMGTQLDLTRDVMSRLGKHLAEKLEEMAIRIIQVGMIDGTVIVKPEFSFEQTGCVLNYTIFPADANGRQVLLSGGGQENRVT